jgi:hypothetical protein
MHELNLSRIENLSFDSVYEVGKMLENNKSLKFLDLSRNYTAMAQGMIVVMARLERNTALQKLKVNHIVANECTF